ncbi:MAG: hypothetical protein FJ395_04025 [Verrucomicrobia bacterium]|nr:hypothetical protein [Verrucomicrobiota bacterium]
MKWLIFTALLAIGVCAAQDANLVVDPGFEDNAGPWRLRAPVYGLTTNKPHAGKYCLQYTNDDPSRYWLCGQPLKLQPGRRYEITARVRTENIKGDENGATICVEWSDAEGKFLGGCYPQGVKGTQRDWQLVRGLTGPVPTNAARGHVSCYVRKGMTGTAWFDDVSVREYIPPAIEAMITDCYRDQTDGGIVNVHVGLSDPQAKVEVKVRDLLGHPVATDLRFDTTPWKPGEYDITAIARNAAGRELGRQSLTLTRVRKFPPRKSYIDRHRRLIVDGEPFFPLGTYWGGIKTNEMAIYAKSPFNCIMPYADVGRAGVDLAHAHGIRVIYSVKDLYVGRRGIKTQAEARQRITQTVNALKDHPAIIAWYINDELPLTMLDELTAHRRWLEELDPGRPTWVVLYQYDQVRHYLPTFDVIGTDPYPIPKSPPSKALEWTRTTVAQTFGARAAWMVPQIFDWASYKKPEGRPPSLAEMRCMAWSCIAAGANGLVFYSWFDLWRMDKTTPFEQRWRDVTTMADEIRRWIPVLLSVERASLLSVEAPATVAWRAFAKDGAVYVLCVNSDDKQPARVQIAGRAVELPPLDAQVVRLR